MENPQNISSNGIPTVMTTEPLSNMPVKPKMKRWKKVLLTIAVIIVVLISGIYFLPQILSITHPGDAALLDDSQIRLQQVSVPDADNGFFDLNQITPNMIQLPANDPNFDLENTNYASSTKWNQAQVDQVLTNSQQALDLFSSAATKQYFQIPDYADPANLTVTYKIYPLNTWRQSARLQAIKALSLSWQNQPDQALLEAAKIGSVGHAIIQGHNSLIGNLVGMSMQQLSSQTILQILPYDQPSTTTLAIIRQSLLNSSDNTQGYKDAFSFEYTHMINSLDEMNSSLDSSISNMVQEGNADPIYTRFAKYGYYYKPNQTKNLYENLYSKEISAIGSQCELDDLTQQLSQNKTLTWRIIFQENAIGKLLFSVSGLALGDVLTKNCQNDLFLNVAQTELALKQYQIDHGALPNTLDDLVPAYIPSVPQDPFTHQPLKYDSQTKTISTQDSNYPTFPIK